MDAQSVYTQAASPFGENYQYPICEVQRTAPQGIFTDTTNTTVSEDFLTTYTNTTPVSGKVYYYATENTGFKARPFRTQGTYSKYNSIDDKIDDLDNSRI